MNTLFVLHKDPDLSLGGVERHTMDLAMNLARRGYSVYLLFPASPAFIVAQVKSTGIEKKRLNGDFCEDMAVANPYLDEKFRELLEEYKVEQVHFQHLLGYSLSLIHTTKTMGLHVFITLHDYFFWCPNYKVISPLSGNTMRFCFFEKSEELCSRCLSLIYQKKVDAQEVRQRRDYAEESLAIADRLVFPTQYMKDVFFSLFDLKEERCTIIQHGIHKTNGSRTFESDQSLNIAYLGAFTYEKGAESFLRVVAEMNDDRYMERITFHVIGELGYPLPKAFRSYPNMRLSGAYKPDDVNVILKRLKIDLVMLPSIWPETYSYTLSEAVVNGIPLIASDLGALRERISSLSAGYLVPYESPVKRSVDIIRDFCRYPELKGYFHERCIDASKKIPDIADMVYRYEKLYKNGWPDRTNFDG